MENLKDTGLNLRKINVSDYARLVEDINHNFSILLSSPVFKGMPGDEGNDGVGTSGERGSRWYWAKWDVFRDTYNLTNQSQVNLVFINGQLIDDLTRLMTALDTDTLIDKDTVVLPGGMLITFNVERGIFMDTQMSFAQNTGVTETRVQQMINDTVGGIGAGSLVFELFKSYAKNFPDSSTAGNNNSMNPDSVLDIASSSSKPGFPVPNHDFVSLATSNMNSLTDTATFVFGMADQYHKLVQRTQNSVGKTTNEYAPGVQDSTMLAVLQDNYKNGVIIGYKDAPTMRDFARIYRDQSTLYLTSNYSMYPNEYGEIMINQDVITVRTKNMAITSKFNVATNMEVLGRAVFFGEMNNNGGGFSVSRQSSTIQLGIAQGDMPAGQTYLIDFLESPRFRSIPNVTFLSTNAQGKVVGSGYSVTPTVNAQSTSAQIPTAAGVMNAINTLSAALNGSIASLTNSLNTTNTNLTNLTDDYNLTKRDALKFSNTTTGVPSDANTHGIYRVPAANSPSGQPGYIFNLYDTSQSVRAQLAVTVSGLQFRGSSGSINAVGWTDVLNVPTFTAFQTAVNNRLAGHDNDISALSGRITNLDTTVNQRITNVDAALTNKINADLASAQATLRAETISAVKGISVSGGLVKTESGQSINIAHPSFSTGNSQDGSATRVITGVTTNNGHVTHLNWIPLNTINIESFKWGMIIDLVAFYIPPGGNWYETTVGANLFSQVFENYFNIDGTGKGNAQHQIATGNTVTIDISKFAICDGRNNTPNLTGVVTIGAGGQSTMTDMNGRSWYPSHTAGNLFIPNTPGSASGGNNTLKIYGHHNRQIAGSEMPRHEHQLNITSVGVQTGNNFIAIPANTSGSSGQRSTTASGGNDYMPMQQGSYALWKIMFIG